MSSRKIDPASLLWHYTGFAGLKGILGGAIWASSLAYLNDTQEYRYTVDIALATLKRITANHDLIVPVTYDIMQTRVGQYFAHIHGEAVFVTCFSGAFDDLSQWRAYAGKGPGFAIGFDAQELAAVAQPDFTLQKCTYDAEAHKLEIEKRLAELIDVATNEEYGLPVERDPESDEDPDQLREEFIDKWTFDIYRVIDQLAPSYKHPRFSAENESRLVGRRPGALGGLTRDWNEQYRLSGSLVVPYVDLQWHQEERPCPIKWILVGPCPHPEAVLRATKDMAYAHNVRPDVSLSEVPFRDW